MRSASAAAMLLIAACGPAPAARPPPSSVEVTLSAQESPPAAPEPPPSAEPPAAEPVVDVVAPPSVVGCTVTGSRVVAGPFPLCLAAEGPCFGVGTSRPAAARLTVTFPEGDVQRAGALVELDDGHVAVRGWTRSEAVRLSPRILFTLGTPSASADFVAPVGDVLEVEGAAQGTATVALRLGPGVTVEGGAARAQRRCNELQIDPTRVEAGTVARFVAGREPVAARQRELLPPGKDTPLSSVPGEPAVARLRPDDERDGQVEILERRGRAARIFWLRDGYAVFGWIPASALLQRPRGAPGGLPGGPAASLPAAPGPRPWICREDVALLVQVAGRHVEVGKVRKGTPVGVLGSSPGYALVELRDPVAGLDGGALWALRAADVTRACEAR